MIADENAIDRDGSTPLHEQVERYLRKLVSATEYQNGALLPDEISLAKQLGVSRNTVRLGMSRLIQDGLVERRAGVGTKVVHRNLRTDLWAWHSFTKELREMGIEPQTFQIEAKSVPISKDIAVRLHLNRGAKLLRLDRLRGWQDEPVVYFRSYLHPRLYLSESEDFTKPLYGIIEERSGIQADHAREELSAALPNPKLARVLQVSAGTPLLFRRRTVYDSSHRPMEYCEIHYRIDRFTLTLDTRRHA